MPLLGESVFNLCRLPKPGHDRDAPWYSNPGADDGLRGFGLDSSIDPEASIFIDDGIRLGVEVQSGVTGTMDIVDGGDLSYNGAQLGRRPREPPSNTAPHFYSKTETLGWRHAKLRYVGEGHRNEQWGSTISWWEAGRLPRLNRRDHLLCPKALSPVTAGKK